MTVTVVAPAKLNLFLGIKDTMPNGFHELEMLMTSVSACDIVTVKTNLTGTVRVRTNSDELPEDDSNIVCKAFEVFCEQAQITNSGIEICIKKNTPMGAGMGGGSANAAAVIVGLNDIYNMEMTKDEMRKMAQLVGADVPFCIGGGLARVTGFGERIERVDWRPRCHYVIVKPNFSVNTKQAFADYDKLSNKTSFPFSEIDEAIEQQNVELLAKSMRNSFEEVVTHPDYIDIHNYLRKRGAINSMLTGSGSAIFGVFISRQEAFEVSQEFIKKGYISTVCASLRHGCKIVDR